MDRIPTLKVWKATISLMSALAVSSVFWVTTAVQGRAQPAEFYVGKTIRVLVGLQAGGTVDTLARALSIYVSKHIPGNPTMIVENMPGAGGANVFNYLAEKATPDGLTIVFGPWDPLAEVLADQTLRARYEDFEYLGGNGDIRIVYARTDTVSGGMKKPSDIAKSDNLVLGALNNTDFSGLLPHLVLNVLGIKHKMIVGYRGGSDVFLAMQRGEVQVHSTSITAYRTRVAPFVNSGEMMGISHLVPVDREGHYEPSSLLPDVPAFPDLYRQIYGKMPSGSNWNTLNWLTQQVGELTYVAFAPRGTPREGVAALRKGFGEACSDPEFVRESILKNKVPYSCVGIERGESILHSLAEAPPEVIKSLRASIGMP
jgi:tripartite-type tricarboxylate transporter receptor subunit TctC